MQVVWIFAGLALVLLVTVAFFLFSSSRKSGKQQLRDVLKKNGINCSVFPKQFFDECDNAAYEQAKSMLRDPDHKPLGDLYQNLIQRDAIIISAIMKDPSSADMNPDMRDRLKRYGIIY